MPKNQRIPATGYPGVYFIEIQTATRRSERVYYIRYKIDGKRIEEKIGHQYKDNMTPAKASRLRTARIERRQEPNTERRRKANETPWTFDLLWAEYKEHHKGKSIGKDESRYKKHISPILGKHEPKDLIPMDLDRIRVNLAKAQAASSVRNALELVRRISNFAQAQQICPGLPFKVKMPTVNNEKTETLAPDQYKSLVRALNQTKDKQIAGIMKLALYTGMRRGEILKLRWDDIDFERGFILLRNPKSGKDKTIPLNKSARGVLQAHPRAESPYVFPGRLEGPRKDIKRSVENIREKADLPAGFRPMHGLRHVYASMLASSGQVDLYTLQKLLTHGSAKMTQRYAHLADEALQRAAATASRLIEDASLNEAKEA